VLLVAPAWCAAQVQHIDWNLVGGSGLWDAAANWSPQNVPDATDELAHVPTVSGATTIDLNTSPNIDGLLIESAMATVNLGGYTLTLGPGGLTNHGVIIASSGTSVINGPIANGGTGQIRIPDIQALTLAAPTIANSGTIELAGGYWGATLSIAGDTTLTGNGMLRLGASGVNVVRGTSPSDRLTNAAGHTIRGWGSLGNNSLALTNEGAIETGAGQWLTVNPTDGTTTYNNGTMQAIGGTLNLRGSYDNTGGTIQGLAGATVNLSGTIMGGTIQSLGGSTVTMGAGTVTGATLQAQAGSTVEIGGGVIVSGGTVGSVADGVVFLGGELRDLATAGTVSVFDGRHGVLRGTITNSGTIAVDDYFYRSFLFISGNTTLTGTGVLRVGGSGWGGTVRGTSPSDRLTNAAGHTIRGGGSYANLGEDSLALTNQGVIEARTGEGLNVDPTDGTTTYNTGTMQAIGGTLNLFGGSYDNAGGTIQALAGATVNISGAVTGGTIRSLGGSTVSITAGTVTGATVEAQTGSIVRINSVIVTGGTVSSVGDGVIMLLGSELRDLATAGTVVVPNGYGGRLGGTITNSGVVEVWGGSPPAYLFIASDTTLTGGGLLHLGGYAVVLGTAPSYRLTNAAGHTIRGLGALGADSLALTNEGVIDARTGFLELVVDPADGTIMYNPGTMQASAGALVLNGGRYDNTGGTIQALAGSTVEIRGAVTGGRVQSLGSSLVRIGASTTPNDPTRVVRLDALVIEGGANPTATLDLNNNTVIRDYTGPVGAILTDVTAQIRSGRNGEDGNDQARWDGPGIISTYARRSNAGLGRDIYNLGAIDNADLDRTGIGSVLTEIAGQAVDPSTVLIKYTYSGDADLNGVVDGDDYSYWLNGFLGTTDPAVQGWLRGDFNYDGRIDGDDYTQWLNSFLFAGPPLAGAGPSPAPEPATLALLSIAAAGLLALDRQKRRRLSAY
jgi:hypothetical protein